MSEKVKSCPFCRNKNINVVVDNIEYSLGLTDDAMFRVICSKDSCGCGASSGWHNSKEEVIKAWNRRAEADSDGLEPAIRHFED